MERREREKCADDPVLSIFSNLHRAAKKKRDYIWSMNKFSSLDSVWGDPKNEMKKNITDKTSKIEYKVSKPHRKGTNRNPSTSEIPKIKPNEERTNIIADVEFLKKSDEKKTSRENSQNTPIGCAVRLEEQTKSVGFKQGSSNAKIDENIPFMKSSTVSCVRATSSRKIPHSYHQCEETGRGSSMIHGERHIERKKNPENSENFVDNPMKVDDYSKLTQKTELFQRERTRHDSGPTTKSNLPSQKKISGRNEIKDERNTSNTGCSFLKAMLSIKIIKEDRCPEFIVEQSDFNRIRKKFSKLKEILPDIDSEEREINFCADAMKVVIGSLFYPPCNFNAVTDKRTAVEILAVAKSMEMNHFYGKFLDIFLKQLTKENCTFVYPAAVYYNLNEICHYCKSLLPDNEATGDKKYFMQRTCIISVSTYIEPMEYCVNLQTQKRPMNDDFDRDVNNHIVFEAVSRSYVLIGFHILLNCDYLKKDSEKIDVYYSAKNMTTFHEKEEVSVRKPLRPIIAIYFKRKLRVKQNEKAEISVEASIKPNLCFAVVENNIRVKNDSDEFMLDLRSTYKVGNSNMKRFLVGKLLYYPESEKST